MKKEKSSGEGVGGEACVGVGDGRSRQRGGGRSKIVGGSVEGYL